MGIGPQPFRLGKHSLICSSPLTDKYVFDMDSLQRQGAFGWQENESTVLKAIYHHMLLVACELLVQMMIQPTLRPSKPHDKDKAFATLFKLNKIAAQNLGL